MMLHAETATKRVETADGFMKKIDEHASVAIDQLTKLSCRNIIAVILQERLHYVTGFAIIRFVNSSSMVVSSC